MNTTFIPFCIRRPHHDGDITTIELDLYDYATNTKQTSYHWHGDGFGLSAIITGTSYDYILYTAGATVATPSLPTGMFYLVVKDTTVAKSYYSETFAIVSSVSSLIRLEFSNTAIISNIAPFYQVVFLNNTLKVPEYLREDTGDKRNGILVKEKQVLIKSEKIQIPICPEYLVDALMLVPLMDNVYVTPPGGSQTSYSEVKAKDPEWSELAKGAYAKFELQLLTIMSIKKLNYKEMGYTETTEAIIKQGSGLTLAVGDVFVYSVVFPEPMPDTLYTPACPYCVNAALPNELEMPWIPPGYVAVDGFKIYTTVACNVRWTAIHE
jgi:hypothetical protein